MITRTHIAIVSFLILFIGQVLLGVSLNELYQALDSPAGVTPVSCEYVKFKLEKNEYGEYYSTEQIAKQTSEIKWEVCKSAKFGTSPLVGNSCVRSTLGTGSKDYDAQYVSINLRVTGPGLFSFYYMTSTNLGDELVVLVDGEDMISFSGYNEYGDSDYNWSLAYGDEDGHNHATIEINGAGAHAITFRFVKDDPGYDYNDNDKAVYVKDGPLAPVYADYDGDREAYNEDLAAYNISKAYFGNCVWIDGVTWEPVEPELEIALEERDGVVLVQVNQNAEDFEATLHYTLNGKAPKSTDPIFPEEELAIDHSCTFTVAMISGSKTLATASEEITIAIPAPTLAPMPEEGTEYTDEVTVAASGATGARKLRYTTDGSEPTAESPLWEGDLTLWSTTTLKVACFSADDTESSDVTTATYTIKLAAPALAPESGEYEDAVTVTATASTHSQIRYTLDGTAPTESSPLWEGEQTLTAATTLKAACFREGCPASPVAIATYTIQLTAPDLSYEIQGEKAVVTASHERNAIHYTTDGSTPTAESPVWETTREFTEAVTIKAVCAHAGAISSDVVTVEIPQSAPPTVQCKNGNTEELCPNGVFTGVFLNVSATSNDGSTIYYSQNEAPFEPSTTSPFSAKLSDGSILRLRTIRNMALPSSVVTVIARKATATVTIGGEQGDIPLQAGWNMVGLPYAFTQKSSRQLLDAYPIFRYDNTTCSYEKCTDELPAGESIWLFNADENNPAITLNGVSEFGVPASYGYSFVAPETFPASARLWSYEEGLYHPVQQQDFKPGTGYLVEIIP